MTGMQHVFANVAPVDRKHLARHAFVALVPPFAVLQEAFAGFAHGHLVRCGSIRAGLHLSLDADPKGVGRLLNREVRALTCAAIIGIVDDPGGLDLTGRGLPKPGGKVWYDDQREVHRQIFEGDETIDYAFMGQDPDAADNRWLREAFEHRIPIIYFLGIAPGRYLAMLPTFISAWDGKALKAGVAFGAPDQETLAPPETTLERRYALRAAKQRLGAITSRPVLGGLHHQYCRA